MTFFIKKKQQNKQKNKKKNVIFDVLTPYFILDKQI